LGEGFIPEIAYCEAVSGGSLDVVISEGFDIDFKTDFATEDVEVFVGVLFFTATCEYLGIFKGVKTPFVEIRRDGANGCLISVGFHNASKLLLVRIPEISDIEVYFWLGVRQELGLG